MVPAAPPSSTCTDNSEQELALILEDDMYTLRWPPASLVYVAPPGWHVLQLYSMGPIAQEILARPQQMWLPWNHSFWGTNAYVVNRAGMQQVPARTAV